MKAELLKERSAVEHSIAEFLQKTNKPATITDVIATANEPAKQRLTKFAIRHMLEQGKLTFDNEFRLTLKG